MPISSIALRSFAPLLPIVLLAVCLVAPCAEFQQAWASPEDPPPAENRQSDSAGTNAQSGDGETEAKVDQDKADPGDPNDEGAKLTLDGGPTQVLHSPPKKLMEITDRYVLGLVREVPKEISDAEISADLITARSDWGYPICQLAWYGIGQKPGQGVLAVGESADGKLVKILRPKSAEEALRLEKSLGFPTTPGELARAYTENEVTASDDFQGKTVIFTSVISDIARGAFNQPYVFFPSEEGSFTGLTCYFPNKDPNLRKIRKGSVVSVRGTVKGFLMQDVILERCDILSVSQ